MTYSSLLEAYGWERFAADAREAGASSLIVADLPVDVRPELRRVQLVAPTSTDERIALAAGATDGWLYLVTVAGTTGARNELSPALAPLVERTRALTDVPLYAGFGISTPEQAAAAARARGRRRRRLRRAPRGRGGPGAARALRRSAARGARLSDQPLRAPRARPRARVDVLEVAGVSEEPGARTDRPAWARRRRVARRDAQRDGLVAVTVQDELWDAEGHPLTRRRERPTPGCAPGRRAAPASARQRARARRRAEVEDAGLRHAGAIRTRGPGAGRAGGSVGRAAAQMASWPPAECPTARTRARSSGASRSASWSRRRRRRRTSPASPPPPPTRRYSRFHAARPCAARSTQSPSICVRSYLARQYPPWTTTPQRTARSRVGGRALRPGSGGSRRSASNGSCARQESNLRPRAPEARALSPELRARGATV